MCNKERDLLRVILSEMDFSGKGWLEMVIKKQLAKTGPDSITGVDQEERSVNEIIAGYFGFEPNKPN